MIVVHLFARIGTGPSNLLLVRTEACPALTFQSCRVVTITGGIECSAGHRVQNWLP